MFVCVLYMYVLVSQETLRNCMIYSHIMQLSFKFGEMSNTCVRMIWCTDIYVFDDGMTSLMDTLLELVERRPYKSEPSSGNPPSYIQSEFILSIIMSLYVDNGASNTRKDPGLRVSVEHIDGQCSFLLTNLCLVYIEQM